MTKATSEGDFADALDVGAVIFDNQNRERSPFELNCCCFRKSTCNRTLFILLFHYSIIFAVVLFSIGYLALSSQTHYHSGVLALLSACIGYIIPSPRA